MTNNDETLLREVDQALADDKQADELKKSLPGLLVGAALVVAAVGGWELYKGQRDAAAEKASIAYQAVGETQGAAATDALDKIAKDGGGYAVLAKMRLAAGHAQKGENDAALALYREIYAGTAPKRVKDLARIRAAYLSLADSREAVIKDIGSLEEDKTELGFFAREALGLAAIKAGDYQGAEQIFLKAAASADAPEAVKSRASEFAALAADAKAGVTIPQFEGSSKSSAERYIDQLNKESEDLSSVLSETAPATEAAPERDATAPDSAAPAIPETQKSE